MACLHRSGNHESVLAGLCGNRRFHPEPDAAAKRVEVGAAPHILWELLQLLRVATAEDGVIGGKRVVQVFLSPTFLEGLALGKTQPSQLQRHDYFIENQGRSQTGAEPKEKHPAASITTEGLHGGIVHQLDRFAER